VPSRKTWTPHYQGSWCIPQHWRLWGASGKECWERLRAAAPNVPKDTRTGNEELRQTLRLEVNGFTGYFMVLWEIQTIFQNVSNQFPNLPENYAWSPGCSLISRRRWSDYSERISYQSIKNAPILDLCLKNIIGDCHLAYPKDIRAYSRVLWMILFIPSTVEYFL